MGTLQTFLHNKWIVIIASLVIGFAIFGGAAMLAVRTTRYVSGRVETKPMSAITRTATESRILFIMAKPPGRPSLTAVAQPGASPWTSTTVSPPVLSNSL